MANSRFIPSLESTRGFAALTVCLFHASDHPYRDGIVLAKNDWGGILFNGNGAVVLFFVLSGFVLRSSLEKRFASQGTAFALDFLIARIFRLFPVIIVTAVLYSIAFRIFLERGSDLEEVVRNALLFDTTLNSTFWTLRIELIGSVLVLIVFLMERRWGMPAVFVVLAALLPLSFTGQPYEIGSISPRFFYLFILGYLVAVLMPQQRGLRRSAPVLLGLALAMFYGAYALGDVYKQWPLLITALASTLIVLVLSGKACRERLQWPPIRFLGAVSYSFYAVHLLGVQIDGALRAPLEASGWPSWIAIAMMLVAPVVVTMIMTLPMYYWVERPGVELGKWITARRATAMAG